MQKACCGGVLYLWQPSQSDYTLQIHFTYRFGYSCCSIHYRNFRCSWNRPQGPHLEEYQLKSAQARVSIRWQNPAPDDAAKVLARLCPQWRTNHSGACRPTHDGEYSSPCPQMRLNDAPAPQNPSFLSIPSPDSASHKMFVPSWPFGKSILSRIMLWV